MSALTVDPDPPPDEVTVKVGADLSAIFDPLCEMDFLSTLYAPEVEIDLAIAAPELEVNLQSVKSAAGEERNEEVPYQKERWSTADILEHVTEDHSYIRKWHNKYDLGPYIGKKSLKDIAFDELVYASMRWGVEFNWSSEKEVKGYMAHIGLIAMKAMAGLYDSEAMSRYDDNVRKLAEQQGTSVFTGSNIDFRQRSVGSNTKEPEITTEEPHMHPESDVESEKPELMTEEPDKNPESDTESEKDTENTLYECSVCEERFSSMKDVSDHVHTHVDDIPHDVPDTTEEKELPILRSLRKPSFQYTYKCKHCGKELSSRNILIRHIKETHSQKKNHECDICGVKIGRLHNLKNHMMIHTGEKPYKCPDCGTGFARISTMKLHRVTHKSEKIHQCSVCGRMFKLWSTLKSHMITHTGERPYQCSICGRRFGRLDYLKYHMKCHIKYNTKGPIGKGRRQQWLDDSTGKSKNTQMEGSDCAIDSTVQSEMKETQVEKTLYACSFCQDLFDSMSDACDHMVNHKEALIQLEMTKNTPAVCEELEEAVTREPPPYNCSLCSSIFENEAILQAHMLKHNIENLSKYVRKHVVSGVGNENQKSLERKVSLGELIPHEKQIPKRYQCTQCAKRFQMPSQLKMHMVTHTGEKAFMCPACGKQFKYAHSLNTHMKAQAEGKPCPRSGRRKKSETTEGTTETEGNLCPQTGVMRKKKTTGGTRHPRPGLKFYTCTVCGKNTPSPYLLKRHMLVHTGEKPYQCSVCGKQYSQPSHLKRHMAFHTGNAPVFPCTLCDVKCTTAHSLKTHMRTHTGERPYLCSQCPAAFKASSILKTHMMTHTDERPHVCSECGKKYKLRSSLKMHMKTHTWDMQIQDGEKPLCTVCGKEFANIKSLRIHMLIHTGERRYQCAQCGKSFKTNCTLSDHIRTHTGELRYSCSECGERFSQRSSLSLHKKWKHTDPSLHKEHTERTCSECGKKFTRESSLQLHMTLHTGKKPYQCHQCGSKFTRADGLDRHMLIHTGKKPYSCAVCGKSFREKGNMNQHMRTHTGEPVRRRKRSPSGIQVTQTSEIDTLISSMVSHEEYVT